MSVKTDLWDYLNTLGQANDVSVGGFPDTPDNVVVLEQYPGLSPVYIHDLPTKPAYERPSIQARARSLDPVWAEDRVNELLEILCLTNITINGKLYQRVYALTSAMYMGKDLADRHHYTVNFGVWKNFGT